MKRFAGLFAALDGTTSTNAKVAALAAYFADAPEQDRLWTVALLSGRRPKRAVTTTQLRQWAAEQAGIPLWLFEESYPVVGDLAETIALILPPAERVEDRSLSHWIDRLRRLSGAEEAEKKETILESWADLPTLERFLFNKLLTGGFRMGVSQRLMTRALARTTGLDEAELAHRLMGDWSPEHISWEGLILSNDPATDLSRPYPFSLAYGLDAEPEYLGNTEDWLAEWKWDGIRGQLILRGGAHHLWSRGEELMTDRFPELAAVRDWVSEGTVIDGEVLVWMNDAPQPFAMLQKRMGRKTVPKKLLAEAPVRMLAYDLLEWDGQDIRDRRFSERRDILRTALKDIPETAPIGLSPGIGFDDWGALAQVRAAARERGAEGVMLKRLAAPYRGGRRRGDWWKWKLDPLTIDAVMVYAQAGHGRRATLYTDYTFAVRDGADWVPFTKAYSGLTDTEFNEITRWIRKNTLERFGPVRRVAPELVFEIGFEGIQASPRHKSGVALRFPRMLRWRRDKPVAEVNTLDDLKAMLAQYG